MKHDLAPPRKLARLTSDDFSDIEYDKMKTEHVGYLSSDNNAQPIINGAASGSEEKEKRTRSRKWSDEEVDLFLKILGDTRYMFAASLENLVPKKRSNFEIFTNIKNVFRRELKERQHERCPGFEYSMSLDLSIEKLRKKYSNLKVEWRRMTSERQGKEDSHHLPEPRWYRSVQKLMTDIKISSEKVNRRGSIDERMPENTNVESDVKVVNDIIEEPTFVVISNRSSNTNNVSLYSNSGSQPSLREYSYESAPQANCDISSDHNSDDSRRSPLQAHPPTGYAMRVRPQTDYRDYPYPGRKPRMMCCDGSVATSAHNVNDLANGLKQLAELQMKRQRMIIDADFRTYDLFLKHKEQEAAKNRAHELRLAEIYAHALSSSQQNQTHERISPPPYQMRSAEHSSYRILSDVEKEMVSPTFSSHLENSKTNKFE